MTPSRMSWSTWTRWTSWATRPWRSGAFPRISAGHSSWERQPLNPPGGAFSLRVRVSASSTATRSAPSVTTSTTLPSWNSSCSSADRPTPTEPTMLTAASVEHDAPEPDCLFLDARLDESLVQQTGHDDGRQLAIVIRDDDGRVIGGVQGLTWGGCCELL